ncbi:CPBP family intramembrane glutamic endopeptidase [Granulicatella adiacens]
MVENNQKRNVFIFIFFMIVFILQGILIAYLQSLAIFKTIGRRPYILLLDILTTVILTAVFYFSYKKLNKKGIKYRFNLKSLLYILFFFIVCKLVNYFCIEYLSEIVFGRKMLSFFEYLKLYSLGSIRNTSLRALFQFENVVKAPILEELLFRGLLQGVILEKWSRNRRILFVTLVFALAHAGMYQNIFYFIPYFVFSLALSVIYEKRRSLFDCILLHSLANGLLFIVIFDFPIR